MKELSIQKTRPCQHCHSTMRPYSDQDAEIWSEYGDYQVMRAKVSGHKKQRSLQQLRLYWACCQTVAENSEAWKTKEAVDFNIRVALDFRDPARVAVRPDGTVQFYYRSIAFKNLRHMEACRYFDRAFEAMAAHLGVTVGELVENAE